MQPEFIRRFDINAGLNDYSNNHSKYLYKYGKDVYYFFIHDMPEKNDLGFSFDTSQKLIVLLYSKGLISFIMTKVKNKWQPEPGVLKTISKDILKLIVQKID